MYYDYVCLHTVLQVATILLVVNCIGHSRLYEHVSLDVYTQYVLEKDTIKQDATDISKQVFFFKCSSQEILERKRAALLAPYLTDLDLWANESNGHSFWGRLWGKFLHIPKKTSMSCH